MNADAVGADVRPALGTALVALEQANEDLRQFAYVASHDLSEPLRVITGFLELLAEELGPALPPTAKEYLSFVTSSAERMRQLLDDLLGYARIGWGPDGPVEVSLDAVLATALEPFESTAGAVGAEIHAGGLPVVSGDRAQLVRLFEHVLGNALKFRSPQRVPRIEVSATRLDETWRITVADNGIGIGPGHRDRVFKMFHRLHTREEYEGTGIGLALCQRIVQLHGGEIGIDDPDGDGTIVWFTLPIEPPLIARLLRTP